MNSPESFALWWTAGTAPTWSIDPPRALAETYLDMIGKRRLPFCDGLIETPIVMPDGRAITQAGYDRLSRLFFVNNSGAWPAIPNEPTLDDAVQAIQAVCEIPLHLARIVQCAHLNHPQHDRMPRNSERANGWLSLAGYANRKVFAGGKQWPDRDRPVTGWAGDQLGTGRIS